MRLALFALLLAATAAAVEPPADKAKFHVFVLMGQSNMAGSALPFLDEYKEPSARVLVQNPDLTWSGAKTPLRGGGMSPGESFARHYAELHPGVTVGLIQCARGGRSIKELGKGGKDRDGAPNYDNTIKWATAAAKQGTITGVLWHQGESDCGDAGYNAKLGTLAADLRADLGLPQLPFICGELGRYAPWTAGFNGRIGAAAKDIPRCAVATSEDLLDLGDKVHFSGFSAEILGSRYLMQYLQLAEPALAPAFKPELAKLTTAMLAREAAWKVLLNGDMSEGGVRPFGWDSVWTGKGQIEVVRDTADAASAPASLRIASKGGPAQGSIGQPLREVAGKTITITAQVKNAGFASCRIIVTGIDGSWKQTLNQPVVDGTAAKAWTKVSGQLAIPASVPNCRIALGVDGEGQAWFDDVAVAVADTPAAAPGANLLQNPSLSDGDGAPAGWTATWASAGKVASARDTAVFKTAPAALRIESVGGAAKGNASQGLDGLAGKQVRITGWMKTDGKVGAGVGIGSFDGAWKMLQWDTITGVGAGSGTEWTQFDKTVTIPAGTVKANLGTTIDGDGKAWFDDLSVTVVQ